MVRAGMRSLFSASLGVLSSRDAADPAAENPFANYHGKTLVRACLTHVADALACGIGSIFEDGLLAGGELAAALLSSVDSSIDATAPSWVDAALGDPDTYLRATAEEVSCAVAALVSVHNHDTAGPPAGVVSAMTRAMQSHRPCYVRASAVDAVSAALSAMLADGSVEALACRAATCAWVADHLCAAVHDMA